MDIDYYERLYEQLDPIAAEMDQLRASPNAEIQYHIFIDSIVWSDEFPPNIAGRSTEFESVKLLLRYRTLILLETPDEMFKRYWDRGLELFPNWCGFLKLRRTPTQELKEFHNRESEQGMRRLRATERYINWGKNK